MSTEIKSQPYVSGLEGLTYQEFVVEAHGINRKPTMRNGAYHWVLDSLIVIEQKSGPSWKLPARDLQIQRVRKYLARAVDKYIEKTADSIKKSALLLLKDELDKAEKSSEFVRIIWKANGILGQQQKNLT